MTLDEMNEEHAKVEEVEEENLEEYESSVEADYSNSLSLLEDCFGIFSRAIGLTRRFKDLNNKEWKDWHRDMENLSLEVLAFVAENKYDVDEDDCSKCAIDLKLDL